MLITNGPAEPTPRRISTARKFIPNGDSDLSLRAWSFAKVIAMDAAGLGVAQADSDALTARAEAFRQALQESRFGDTRGPAATRRKEDARRELETIMRRLARQLRGNEALDDPTRITLALPVRRTPRPRAAALPPEPPLLTFKRAVHENNGAVPVHELEFREFHSRSKARPDGAARLELFVDLIGPDEPIPRHPGANLGGRPWYLRSYTRNPITLTPPMTRVPMRPIYWARWADSLGNVGPFSAAAAGWVEGGSHLPSLSLQWDERKRLKLLEDPRAAAEGRDPMILVTVLEAQYQSYNPTAIAAVAGALPEGEPLRQLEGPAEQEDEDRAAA